MQLFAFGNNLCGQLANGEYACRVSKSCSKVPFRVRHISIGCGHSAFISDDHSLYVCGWNTYGQLGLNDTQSLQMTPKKVEQFVGKCAHVECGGGFTLLMDTKGQIFNCGANESCQLGDNTQENNKKWQQVDGLGNVPVKLIVAAASHSLVVNENGELYGWGKNDNGQLGIGETSFAERRPRKISPLASYRVKKVFSKFSHSFVLTESGELFGFGFNLSGQLGNSEPPLAMHTAGRTTIQWKENVFTPQRITRFGRVSNIKQIATGESHTVILKNDGRVYFIGSDKQRSSFARTLISIPRHIRIANIFAGQDFTLAITENQRVFSWGSNTFGQLGSCRDRPNPQEITHLRGKVNSCQCGWNSVIVFWKPEGSKFATQVSGMWDQKLSQPRTWPLFKQCTIHQNHLV